MSQARSISCKVNNNVCIVTESVRARPPPQSHELAPDLRRATPSQIPSKIGPSVERYTLQL